VTATSVADATKSASASISLSPHEVDLSWNAPSSSADPVAGYKVYRSSNSGSTYQLLNSSVDTATTYADTTVMAGQTYDYIVESVDAAGYTSLPSNMFSVTVP
jgi:fibronectin type 3 domain-containing protein